jgi:ABC-type glycerol-3-phosphate transport system substrate-binding protein
MKLTKKTIITALIFLASVSILSILFLYPHSPRVLINTAGYDGDVIYNFISHSYQELDLESINSNNDKKAKKPDLIIEPLNYNMGLLSEVNNNLFSTIPRSIARTGVIDGKIVALPIFLDHIEIAFRQDLYTQQGLTVEDRILSLRDMENVLLKLVNPSFFPLVMAGSTDAELLDVLSVLTLSLGGVDSYLNLTKLLNSKETPESYINFDLGDGWNLGVVIDKLNYWKESGIIHPQWYSFDTKQVELYSERQITSTVIMRLTTHRSWPFHILRRWQSSPFPFNNPNNAGSGVIAPTTVAYIPQNAKVAKETQLVLQKLISKDFQESIVKKLQLAPVHSTADTLDRESDDLRFWAAASTLVLQPINTYASKESLTSFTKELRGAIVQ